MKDERDPEFVSDNLANLRDACHEAAPIFWLKRCGLKEIPGQIAIHARKIHKIFATGRLKERGDFARLFKVVRVIFFAMQCALDATARYVKTPLADFVAQTRGVGRNISVRAKFNPAIVRLDQLIEELLPWHLGSV